jgi:cytochrome c-type biogenesis protein CcmH
MIRRYGPWIALGVVVVVVLAIVLWPGGARTAADRAHDLETQLKCPECQGLSVADSQAPTSRAIRADIKVRIAKGESDAQIRQVYVDKYGSSILLAPRNSGLGLIVWVLPVVVLALGAAGIVFALARNRREPHLHATAADESLVERELAHEHERDTESQPMSEPESAEP